MKNLLLLSIIFIFLQYNNSFCKEYLHPSQKSGYFLENKGQWDSEAQFYANSNDMDVWITNTGLVFDLQRIKNKIIKSGLLNNKNNEEVKYVVERNPVKMIFKNSKKGVVCKDNKYETYFNYLIGNESEKWIKKLHPYKSILVKGIYDGIDLKYHFEGERLRYDLLLEPNAVPEQIKLEFKGHKSLEINRNGHLIINTEIGSIEQCGVFAFQLIDNKKVKVECSFKLDGKGFASFELGHYDKTKMLVIDPLVFSIAVCGKREEEVSDIAVDKYSNVYITGYTVSKDFPITINNFLDTMYYTGYIYISKMNSSGDKLLFSTLIGSRNKDRSSNSRSLCIDEAESIFIAGNTQAEDFPITENAYKKIKRGNRANSDDIILKLDSTGCNLIFSTFLNKPNAGIDDMKIDKIGNVYVAGSISDSGLQVTNNAIKKEWKKLSPKGNYSDAYILKLNNTGSDLLYCTYFGGDVMNEHINSIYVDSLENIYFTGWTQSTDFPTTPNAYQKKYTSTNSNCQAFVAKINTISGELIFSTLLGKKTDHVSLSNGIVIDENGCVFICGESNITNDEIPFTENAYRFTGDVCHYRLFIIKFNNDCSDILISAGICGFSWSSPEDMIRDNKGNIYISGVPYALTFPTTADAYQSGVIGYDDVFICKFNPDLSKLLYSTILGGYFDECNTSIAVDDNECLYITGFTISDDFPITNQDFPLKGRGDVFLAKFDLSTDIEEKPELNTEDIIIFPNPAANTCTLKFHNEYESSAIISISDILGRNLRRFSHSIISGENTINFNVEDLPPGLYFVKVIIAPDKVMYARFIR